MLASSKINGGNVCGTVGRGLTGSCFSATAVRLWLVVLLFLIAGLGRLRFIFRFWVLGFGFWVSWSWTALVCISIGFARVWL